MTQRATSSAYFLHGEGVTFVFVGRSRGCDGVIKVDGGGVEMRVVYGNFVMRKEGIGLPT